MHGCQLHCIVWHSILNTQQSVASDTNVTQTAPYTTDRLRWSGHDLPEKLTAVAVISFFDEKHSRKSMALIRISSVVKILNFSFA